MIVNRINSDCMFMLKIQIADRVLEIPGNCIGLLEATGINRILRKQILLSSCYEVEGLLLEIHESRIAEIEFIKREMNKRHKKRISAIGIYYLEDDYTDWFDTARASNKKQTYRITSMGDMRISLGTKIENYYTKYYETSPSGLFGKYDYLATGFDREGLEGAEWRSYDEIIDLQTMEAMGIINDIIKHTRIKLGKSTNQEKKERFVLTLAITEQYILGKYHHSIRFINYINNKEYTSSVVCPRLCNILGWMKKSEVSASPFEKDISDICEKTKKYDSVGLREIFVNKKVLKNGLEGL